MFGCRLYEIPQITLIPEHKIKDSTNSLRSVVIAMAGNDAYKEFIGQAETYVAYQLEISVLDKLAKEVADAIINHIKTNVGGRLIPWDDNIVPHIELVDIKGVGIVYEVAISAIDHNSETFQKHILQVQVRYKPL